MKRHIAFLIILTLFTTLLLTGCNSPRPTEYVNDDSVPLQINEEWGEDGAFRFNITNVQKVDMDYVINEYANEGSLKISEEYYMENGENTIPYEFCIKFENINYDGYFSDRPRYNEKLSFHLHSVLNDEKDDDIFRYAPLLLKGVKRTEAFPERAIDGSPGGILKGEKYEESFVIFVSESTSSIEIITETPKGSLDYTYRRTYIYNIE